MKDLCTILIVATQLLGCASPDPIDKLAARLAINNPEMGRVGLFPNGIWRVVHLPPTATSEDLVKESLAAVPWVGVTNFTVLRDRQIYIKCEGMMGENYRAILISSPEDRRIVLARFHEDAWMSRVYDAK
jgi:hypothetical protein